ncbi:hypothetical protein ACJIZ3_000013 [Penstemon smallii]|uniref:Nucleolar complex protein 2 homolog n=1 Tax=Penstemon smallii TaxID=265156 RepID=A0ABD3RBU0_9LAMI
MGKLGKKARKFAKKHLQSELRRRRKTKASFKKKSPKDKKKNVEEQVDNEVGLPNERSTGSEGIENISLDVVFIENDKDEFADASDSDGYLSEDSSYPYVMESETGNALQDEIATSTYSTQNNKLHADLAIQMKKLDRLRKKDPKFSKFLESYDTRAETFQKEDEYSDEGDSSDQGEQGEDDLNNDKKKILTNDVINTWCQMVKEEHSQSALISLLNAYRTACHYGAESIGHKIDNSETFCNILLFVLSNADDTFRGLLQISSLKCNKETLQELKKTSKWKSLKPLIKSYVRSTLFLLNQVTDTDILALAMTRVRASLIFFVAFPSLIQRLIKATVHLWATGGKVLSLASFHITRDVTAIFSSSFFDTCLSKSFLAFISCSRVLEISDIRHMQFLRDCIVELCSLDMQKSSLKAAASISQLAKILQLGVQTKKKEAVKKICSWEFVNCIELWVRFISANIRDYDLQPLFFMIIQLINGLAHTFPGPRYIPLRLKCIEWLNYLSSSSETFIPLASLLLDILEYKVGKEGKKAQIAFNFASVLKLPKHNLKLKDFQEECFHSALEQLSLHFAQWSHHISFPDLAAIPLIRLRKFLEITMTESFRRTVKRLIDQVEQNVEFVQKKRDDVPFSPHDHKSVESFLQLEKSSPNTSFTQYYKSVLEKAADRNLHRSVKTSLPEQKKLKRERAGHKRKTVAADLNADAHLLTVENGFVDTKQKRRAIEVK